MPIPQDFTAPSHVSAKERALAQIQHWIVDGTFEAGERLNDGDLAHVLGMSRTPVREALQVLSREGFVETRAGRDTRVTPVDPTAIRQVYPPLAALEAVAASSAAAVIDTAALEELRLINQRLREAIRLKDADRTLEEDEQFHSLIVAAADNPYLTPLVSTLHRHVRRLRYTFFRDAPAPMEPSVTEHQAIIEALAVRSAEDAARWVRQNWLRPMEEMEAFWASR